jgi:hypothetical protein
LQGGDVRDSGIGLATLLTGVVAFFFGAIIARVFPYGDAKSLSELLTVLVLVGQLIVFWQQRRLMAGQLTLTAEAEERAQRHDRLSVRPYIDLNLNRGDDYMHFWIQNEGSGVAIITDIETWIDGTPYVVDPTAPDLMDKLITRLGLTVADMNTAKESAVHSLVPPTGLSPGSRIDSIKLHILRHSDVRILTSRIAIRVTYESIYKETFSASVGNVPTLSG